MKVKLAEEKVSALKNELQSKEHELTQSKGLLFETIEAFDAAKHKITSLS